jgi:Zn-dependent peptidase ImmA (M78 family)
MDTYEKLLNRALKAGIPVLEGQRLTASIKMDGLEAIFIGEHTFCSLVCVTEALAHELGHCETGAFYGERSPKTSVRKCERMADCWAVFALLPPERLRELTEAGHTEIYSLAEAAGRSEEFVRKALEIYRAKGLLTDG